MALDLDLAIAAALEAGDVAQLRALAERHKTPDLAEQIQALSPQHRAVVFRTLQS